jgi:hypothetical protein
MRRDGAATILAVLLLSLRQGQVALILFLNSVHFRVTTKSLDKPRSQGSR